ncbi:kinase-like domain-containing protein [Rhizophagus clarus]|uniref:Kinase-like domain-containing protein n=1 Tax=Rhizophagus clarus TaxID=94130 RepID=A0A8H3LUC4_9GLOM|nr:kinase-like domain-containing protein [Rhizophagus clarus]
MMQILLLKYGLRPPIVTIASEGYIELMQKCWHSDPNERPNANDIWSKFWNDIGPITNNPGAIYKSRPLNSVKSTISLKSESSIILELYGKRKFNNNLIENDNEEPELDINDYVYSNKPTNDNSYVYTAELDFDI